MTKQTGYSAVFYSGHKIINFSDVRKTKKEAQQDIDKMNDIYRVFKYTPWDRAVIEEVNVQ